MKISVIIPALNEENYIESVLKALLLQDFPRKNFEIIVADNGSTDKTSTIAKKFADKVVKEKKRGTNFARQAGFLASKNEIIACLDADCIPSPDWLSQIESRFSHPKNTKLGLLSGIYYYYDLDPFASYVTLFIDQKLSSSIAKSLNYLTGKNSSPTRGGNMAIRKDALKQIGGFNTKYTFWGDDTNTAIQIGKRGFKTLFDPSLVVKSSARRIKREGHALQFKYLKAYLAQLKET